MGRIGGVMKQESAVSEGARTFMYVLRLQEPQNVGQLRTLTMCRNILGSVCTAQDVKEALG
jgi:hypothetical protein